MPTRIVLLSVADPVLVEGTAEVLDRVNQPELPLVALTRPAVKPYT